MTLRKTGVEALPSGASHARLGRQERRPGHGDCDGGEARAVGQPEHAA